MHKNSVRIALLLSGALGFGLQVPAVSAQQVAQVQPAQQAFDIPAQPLAAALDAFARSSGWQVGYPAVLAQGKVAPAVRGTLTPTDALTRLLAGTGLTYRITGANTVTLAELPQGSSAAVLPVLAVEGKRGEAETAWGPVDGYVARRSASATKTDTSLLETPQSVSVITRDRMTALGAQTVADTLGYSAGVTADIFGSDSRYDWVNIRGFDQSGNSLYRDGLRYQNNYGTRAEQYGLERIDILRGPASVMFGQNGPGGVVNQISKRPLDRGLREAFIEGGSFDHYKAGVDISQRVGEDNRVLYRLTAAGVDESTQVDYVDNRRIYVAPAITWRPNDATTLTILSHVQKENFGNMVAYLPSVGTVLPNPNGQIPVNRFTGEPGFDNVNREQYALGYEIEHQINDAVALRQNLRYSHLKYDFRGQYTFGYVAGSDATLDRFGWTDRRNTDMVAVDNHLKADLQTGALKHTVLAGVDYLRISESQRLAETVADTFNIYNPIYGSAVGVQAPYQITHTTGNQTGLYLQDQLRFDRLALLLGGRYDMADTSVRDRLTPGSSRSQDDDAFTYRAGLAYLFDNGVTPYVGYGESFVPVVGVNAAGAAFRPETGNQYEAGIKYQPPGRESLVTVAAFDLRQQNRKTTDPANPANEIQTGEIRSRGVEFEAVAALSEELRLIAALTRMNVEVTRSGDGDVGKVPVTTPERLASLWADYRFRHGGLAGLGFGAGVRHVGPTYGNTTNTLKVPEFTLYDAAVYYDISNWRFSLNARNLLNEDAFTCSGDNACNYGAARTLVGRVQYSW